MQTSAAGAMELQKSIIEMVDQHWSENHSAMLLTTMGIQIRRFFTNSVDFMPNGLRSFIMEGNLAQIVVHPEVATKVGAVPNGVHLPSDVRELFSPSKGVHRNASLDPQFWNAFHLPISGRRFITVSQDPNKPFNIEHLEVGEPTAERWYEITQQDLALYDGSALPELIKNKWHKINNWIAKNGLEIKMFSADKVIPAYRPAQRGEAGGRPELGVFSRLEQMDQARILIPLDIVSKILSR